jgi:hypothetical protein
MRKPSVEESGLFALVAATVCASLEWRECVRLAPNIVLVVHEGLWHA